MARFNCKVCGFSTSAEKIPERCPFCGQLGSIVEEETAEELLEEVND